MIMYGKLCFLHPHREAVDNRSIPPPIQNLKSTAPYCQTRDPKGPKSPEVNSSKALKKGVAYLRNELTAGTIEVWFHTGQNHPMIHQRRIYSWFAPPCPKWKPWDGKPYIFTPHLKRPPTNPLNRRQS